MSSNSDDVISQVFPKAVQAIRSASGLSAYDIKFYKSLDKNISDTSENSSNRLLKLINVLSSSVDLQDNQSLNQDAIESGWPRVSNLLDTILERSDFALDTLQRSPNQKDESQKFTYLDDDNAHNKGAHLNKRQEKPQKFFKTPIDNSESHPFKPLLKEKPNAMVPFQETFILTTEEENDPAHYKQPYEIEILNQEYNSKILEKSDPIPSKDWQGTEPIWVDTIEELNKMHKDLQSVSEIAVDLEHHDYRSYYGLVCLMQISTRDQDWLIDTLALREDLKILNSVFTDPKITKVFHGAFMDIIWLQRDLGLYIVSLFDTYHASRQLGFPKHSLAYLLERFAHFKTSKKYQLADWRIRPLTGPMKLYARSDTHFLLNIFDQLRNMLIESNKLTNVLFESRNVARRRFEYSSFRPLASTNVVSPIEKPEPWKSLLYQYNLSASREAVVRSLYQWRDQIAKQDDESPRYVMPNQLLVSLASLVPTDPAGVLSSSNLISDHVRKNAKEISELIKRSMKEAEEEDMYLLNNISEKFEEKDTINEDKIEFSEAAFNSELQRLKTNLPSSKYGGSSELFSLSILENNYVNNIINSEGNSNSSTEMKKRINLIRESLSFRYNPTSHHGDDDTSNKSEGQLQKESDVNIEDASTDEKSASMFSNPDDIVVLKKKQAHSRNNTAKKDKDSEKKEVLNYEDASKVMKKKPFEKANRKRSSSTFDPYTLESEGPKPVKKLPKLQMGKNTSFFSKKKK
ncbi:exosome complex exonuclease [Wickerhamomyces ciferrii]|uniref:Exosome complex exonuclease n=1 Tax=Wickerhamomyces ciferrii (strain ATCC 14091 / BCRC 22168 / CBS 111 / JCM 3599 / NBRC 0793 / NRRL Y-1031 F-60-10) TaxID=1206466 RepID=K0KGG1_WICCF|nr:exosome complex exonuclease [Wickerhamomyces ciferrii]CCH42061.1 exosome complex exonuclease [Wickerhamomyces ciferrii]